MPPRPGSGCFGTLGPSGGVCGLAVGAGPGGPALGLLLRAGAAPASRRGRARSSGAARRREAALWALCCRLCTAGAPGAGAFPGRRLLASPPLPAAVVPAPLLTGTGLERV